MTQNSTALPVIDPVARALSRYGHHDHACPERVWSDAPCPCGFNQALGAATRGESMPPFVSTRWNLADHEVYPEDGRTRSDYEAFGG